MEEKTEKYSDHEIEEAIRRYGSKVTSDEVRSQIRELLADEAIVKTVSLDSVLNEIDPNRIKTQEELLAFAVQNVLRKKKASRARSLPPSIEYPVIRGEKGETPRQEIARQRIEDEDTDAGPIAHEEEAEGSDDDVDE